MAVQPTPAWQGPETIVGPAPGVRFAGPGSRLAAYVIDAIVQGVVFLVVLVVIGVVVAGSVFSNGERGAGVALGGILLALCGFGAFNLLYFPWFWSRGGQTPGMRLMAIRVVRDLDGGPVSFGSGVLRLVGYWISNAALYIGFIWIFVDRRRRGWHDLIAGTCVIEA
jgi:uncharacterized RDD family membrane protein YckC